MNIHILLLQAPKLGHGRAHNAWLHVGFQLHEWLCQEGSAIPSILSELKFQKSANFCLCRHLSNVAKILKFTVRVRQIVTI